MRIRTIKPEFWTDATMVQLPLLSRLLFVGLWNCADDHGYLPDEPLRIAMQVLPRENETEVLASLDLLVACGRVERFIDDRGSFLRVTNWEKHQKVDRPSASKIAREGSRKFAIRNEDRRKVALKYGCKPGQKMEAACYFCSAPGEIYWWTLSDGRPSAWVTFPGLELSHFVAESQGGETKAENLVLGCRECNRSMATNDGVSRLLANNREASREIALEGNREQGKEQGREQGAGKPSAAERPAGLARIEAPTTPTVGWSADEFWRWAQSGRGVQEKPPPPRTLSTWWTEARSVASVEALQRAFDEGFCSDPHWRRAAPPFPFAAFMSQWRKWVRPEAPAQAIPECVSCAQPARYGWPEVQLPMCQACMNDAVDFSHERSVLPWEGGAQQWLESRGAEGEVAHG